MRHHNRSHTRSVPPTIALLCLAAAAALSA